MSKVASDDRLEKLYALVLALYPRQFREAYALPMRQAFRDAWSDRALPRRRLLNLLARDLIASLVKEYLNMFRETYARPALIFNAIILAGISTGIALALYAIPQQVLRNGANDPQIQLATDAVARLEDRASPSEAIPAGNVDMARSLAPFIIAYDNQGKPLASQARLNGGVPVLPAGVFDYVRQHGETRELATDPRDYARCPHRRSRGTSRRRSPRVRSCRAIAARGGSTRSPRAADGRPHLDRHDRAHRDRNVGLWLVDASTC